MADPWWYCLISLIYFHVWCSVWFLMMSFDWACLIWCSTRWVSAFWARVDVALGEERKFWVFWGSFCWFDLLGRPSDGVPLPSLFFVLFFFLGGRGIDLWRGSSNGGFLLLRSSQYYQAMGMHLLDLDYMLVYGTLNFRRGWKLLWIIFVPVSHLLTVLFRIWYVYLGMEM